MNSDSDFSPETYIESTEPVFEPGLPGSEEVIEEGHGDVVFTTTVEHIAEPVADEPITTDPQAEELATQSPEVPVVKEPVAADPIQVRTTPVAVLTQSSSTVGVAPFTAEETEETDSDEDGKLSEEERLVPDGRPIIKITGGNVPEILAQAEALLGSSGRFFTTGRQIVSIETDPVTGEPAITPMTTARLSVVLSDMAAWLAPAGRAGGLRRVDAPDSYCSKLLQQERFEQLPPLAGLARQPFLRPDGSLCATPGYDLASKRYAVFQVGGAPVTVAPSRDEAEAALTRLDGLLDEFPFAADYDRSAALCGILTAAVRSSLPLAPMFLVTAPEAGTGKTLLCSLIAGFASARPVAPQIFPRSDDEVDRLLLAELRSNPRVVFFDNYNGAIPAFPRLCAVVTGEHASGRILRSSNTAVVSTRTMLLVSGNNARPSVDMQRRIVTITLDARHEIPAMRKFATENPVRRLTRDRQQFVADALVVIRAWIEAGGPLTPCEELTNFDEWVRWCRQPLLWLGRADPAQSVFSVLQDDPEKRLLGNLLTDWNRLFADRSTKVRDLVARAVADDSAELLREVLEEISDSSTLNPRKIGRWIARQSGRVAGGLRLEKCRKTASVEAWKVITAR
ncbi:MAG: hypothetical protein HY854_12940 [Burkholderiales bacterium]|nr:hypothetical protein [Burkholderiales bacterium]